MIDYAEYAYRTVKHIMRTQNRGLELLESIELSESDKYLFLRNLAKHDASKFLDLQEVYYPAKFNNDSVSQEDELNFQIAWKCHYTIEDHHPEGMEGVCDSKIIAMEMACDLQAMSDEMGEDDVMDYFNNVWMPSHRDDIVDIGDWTRTTCTMKECFECFKLNDACNELSEGE